MNGVYLEAVGICTACGASAEGSSYWTPLPAHIWDIIWPQIAHLFPDPDRIQNPFFIPPHNKPFCGAICSNAHMKPRESTNGPTPR